MAAEPDLILLPGDIFQGDLTRPTSTGCRTLLGRLHAPSGVFFVPGDADGSGATGRRPILDGRHIEILVDEVTEVEVGDRRFASAAPPSVRHAPPTQ